MRPPRPPLRPTLLDYQTSIVNWADARRSAPPSDFECYECREKFPSDAAGLRRHLVDAHGYLADGRAIYKHHECEVCAAEGVSRTGVYRVSSHMYCSKHIGHAQARLRKTSERFTKQSVEKGRYIAEVDRRRKNADGALAQRRAMKQRRK